jgi:phosphoserine aminotransferase
MIQETIDLQKKILKIPDNYFVGIVGGSSTGAIETLMWSLLGFTGIDVISNCIHGKFWEHDIINELKLSDVRIFRGESSSITGVSDVDFDRDVVFCWTSTTTGTSFQNSDWIKSERKGLTICDAVSAVFLFDFDWSKLDATAFAWQKGLGGEAGLGTIVLSPKAIERLESHQPTWPIPRIFRLAQNRKVNFNIFKGHIINTPSMICIEDFINNLRWAEEIGGIAALKQIVENNYAVVNEWISQNSIFKFLVEEKHRAHHIACLDITTEKYQAMSDTDKWAFIKKIVAFCEEKNYGFDFIGHVQAKPNIRIWCGPTVDTDVLRNFLPKLEEAYNVSTLSS